jgi:hypothetical protein
MNISAKEAWEIANNPFGEFALPTDFLFFSPLSFLRKCMHILSQHNDRGTLVSLNTGSQSLCTTVSKRNTNFVNNIFVDTISCRMYKIVMII